MLLPLITVVACKGNEARATETDSPRAAVAPVSGVEVYSATSLNTIASELARASSTGRTFGGHPTFKYVESRRLQDGSAEVHDDWSDVTIVQSGRATLLAGGRVDGGALESHGEHRGGRIVGGSEHAITTGDLFVVPPGVPHQFLVARGDSIRYLTIKVAR